MIKRKEAINMKRYWDKVNDEWIYESEPPKLGEAARLTEKMNLVLLLASLTSDEGALVGIGLT
jgi:hypothetical protein